MPSVLLLKCFSLVLQVLLVPLVLFYPFFIKWVKVNTVQHQIMQDTGQFPCLLNLFLVHSCSLGVWKRKETRCPYVESKKVNITF